MGTNKIEVAILPMISECQRRVDKSQWYIQMHILGTVQLFQKKEEGLNELTFNLPTTASPPPISCPQC